MRHRTSALRPLAFVTLFLGWSVALGLGVWLRHRLAQLDDQERSSWQQVERLRQIVERQSYVATRYQQYAGFWSDEPEHVVQAAFLHDLEDLAGDGQFNLNLKPRPIQRQDSASRLSVEVELEGTQDDLLAFLDQVLAHPSPMDLERLRISTTAFADRPLKAVLLVSRFIIPWHGV